MSTQARKAAEMREAQGVKPAGNYLSFWALVMMNITIVASLANDVQQAFYGLSSVTYFIIGALVFFLPTGLVAAELASGWSERGGIFRWVGEGVGKSWAFVCIFVLWFQTTILFGSGVAQYTATIGFYTPDFDWAVKFANDPTNELLILCAWLAFYWFMCFLATKGLKWFGRIAKYGVILGTFLPLAVIIVLTVVWLLQGNKPAIDMSASALIPKWDGMSTLALAAGVFFSFAGIDMNAAHIKEVKNPGKTYPLAMFVSMIFALLIFIVGTLIIAMVVPNKDLNVLYSLYATYRTLGSTIGAPWLYMVFAYLGLGATMANLITNLAGPSVMLGEAGRSGFLPKALQNKNKHGMPSRLMWLQLVGVTAVAFVVFLLPNVEGFVVLLEQAITILYMIYYILMFVSFIKLRYDQPNRPRAFTIPGGKAGAWLVGGLGICACAFGIALAIYPPAQISKEVGSPVTYVVVVLAIVAIVLGIGFGLYALSRKHDWVDPQNHFAPFTWEIEGLKKPGRVLSNVPSDVISAGQNPMGMPIARPYPPDEQIVLPKEYEKLHHKVGSVQHELEAVHDASTAPDLKSEIPAVAAVGDVAAPEAAVAAAHDVQPQTKEQPVNEESPVAVPPAPAEAVAAAPIPKDADASAQTATTEAASITDQAEALTILSAALTEEAKADNALAEARKASKVAEAAVDQAAAKAKALGIDVDALKEQADAKLSDDATRQAAEESSERSGQGE
jgi:putative glutamate/gamma-aminobutyrate antiporter